MMNLKKQEFRNVSAESLADLNDELAAMIRTGIPLDEGLRSAAKYLRKDSQDLLEHLIRSIEQGASLDEAIDAEPVQLPKSYVTLIKAGLRMGRLSEALSTFTSFARARMRLRQEIGAALLYPAFILIMAFVLSLFVCYIIFPELIKLHDIFQLKNTFLMHWFTKIFQFYQSWYLLIPLIFLLLIFCWKISRHSFMLPREQNHSQANALFASIAYGWIPGYRKLIRDMNYSTFNEMAGVLLSYRVPLPESLILAADSTGNQKLKGQVHSVAKQLEQGSSIEDSIQVAEQLPDYIRSMMTNPAHQNRLPEVMAEMARVYRTRVLNRIEWIKRILPVALLIGVAGGITACYAIIIFLPFVEILKMLGSPSL